MAPLYAGGAVPASRALAGVPLCRERPRARSGGAHLCPLSSLSTARIPLVRLGFHESFDPWPRRSKGNDRKPRPQPETSGDPVPPDGCPRSGGGAADEAAAMRKQRACPLADAKAAGFVKRPGSGPFGVPAKQAGTSASAEASVRQKRDESRRAATGGERPRPIEIGQDRALPGSCEMPSWTSVRDG
jgi:hypothetical protein